MKIILVTGGVGFIGSHLCDYLISKGEYVICVDNLFTGNEKNITHLKKNLKNNVILLKGHVDKIFSRNRIKFNKTGNPRMAVAGTGDVLAGLCAGFLAQSGKLFESACAAAYLNGLIGDSQLRKKGNFFIASDMLGDIKHVKKRITK